MKEQWKEKLDAIPYPNIEQGRIYKEQVRELISSLLEEQKKDLSNRRMYEQGRKEVIEQILKDAPVTIDHICRFNDSPQVCDCYEACNALWRENLSKLIK